MATTLANLKKSNRLVRSGQSKHTMIAKMNKAPGQYKTPPCILYYKAIFVFKIVRPLQDLCSMTSLASISRVMFLQ
jgi:hypothetical protein